MNVRKPRTSHCSPPRAMACRGGLSRVLGTLSGVLRSLKRSVRPEGTFAVELLCDERVYLFGEEQMIVLLPPSI